jgi:ketosteroid isomerase-like protein
VLSLMADDVIFMVPGKEPFGKEAFAASATGMMKVRIVGTSDIQNSRSGRLGLDAHPSQSHDYTAKWKARAAIWVDSDYPAQEGRWQLGYRSRY